MNRMFDLLLHYGGDVNVRTANGSTPLHFACGNGELSNVRYLLEKGADPTLLTYTWGRSTFGKSSGQTCFHWAAESGHSEILDLLAQYDPLSLIQEDERGKTPMKVAEEGLQFQIASHIEEMINNPDKSKLYRFVVKKGQRATKVL